MVSAPKMGATVNPPWTSSTGSAPSGETMFVPWHRNPFYSRLSDVNRRIKLQGYLMTFITTGHYWGACCTVWQHSSGKGDRVTIPREVSSRRRWEAEKTESEGSRKDPKEMLERDSGVFILNLDNTGTWGKRRCAGCDRPSGRKGVKSVGNKIYKGWRLLRSHLNFRAGRCYMKCCMNSENRPLGKWLFHRSWKRKLKPS